MESSLSKYKLGPLLSEAALDASQAVHKVCVTLLIFRLLIVYHLKF